MIFSLPLGEGLLFDILCGKGMHSFQIVGRAHQIPFATHCAESPNKESAKPDDLFDDPKHGLHRALAFGIDLSSLRCPKSMLHPGHSIRIVCQGRGL